MKLIHKILLEALYERDNEQDKKAIKIIDNIEDAFFNYKEDTNHFYFNKNDLMVSVKYDDLTFFLYDERYPKAPQTGGSFQEHPNIIIVYGCKFEWNFEEGKWKYFYFNKNTLYHELIHYLDVKEKNIETNKVNYDKIKIKNKNKFTKKDYKKYLNHGVEFNAHFMENIMPIVKSIYNFRKRDGIKTFDDFKKELFSYSNVKKFYSYLTTDLKKHFMKRIAEYFQKLKF